jgi:hypothetical protein
VPADATALTLTYCSAYGGEAGNSNTSGWDWAWVAVNGVEVDDVSVDGDQLTWETRTVDLSAYVGQSVTLSWNFDSLDDVANTEFGWQVDAIRLTAVRPSGSQDCNGNGLPDECDIASGASADANGNNVPDECESLSGDMNCDGAVGFGDINPFVLALSNPEGWQELYEGCDIMNGDVNGDGEFGFGDINPFVALLAGGG